MSWLIFIVKIGKLFIFLSALNFKKLHIFHAFCMLYLRICVSKNLKLFYNDTEVSLQLHQ